MLPFLFQQYFQGGDVSFQEAQFSNGYSDFSGAEFTGDVCFLSAQFLGGGGVFYLTQFSGKLTNFGGVNFLGGQGFFQEAQFSGGESIFEYAQFSGGEANFNRAKFTGGMSKFSNVCFENKFSFIGAEFKYPVEFIKASFSPKSSDSNRAFRSTLFDRHVDFTDAKNFPLNAFDEVEFQRNVIITDHGNTSADQEFKRVFDNVELALNKTIDLESVKGKNDWLEERYGALERGCMALKLVMENNSDKVRAQRYFKYELLARQKRPSTSWIAKKMTGLYGFFADYGGSISRPLILLICCIIIFGIFFALNANCIIDEPLPIDGNLIGGLDLSLTNSFRPFSIWGEAALRGPPNWVQQYHHSLGKGSWLFIKLLATFQSFFSITMLFLFGLAVKRKFQIK